MLFIAAFSILCAAAGFIMIRIGENKLKQVYGCSPEHAQKLIEDGESLTFVGKSVMVVCVIILLFLLIKS